MHYVYIPAAEDEVDASGTWIQASIRSLTADSQARVNDCAVRQILVLPTANKAFTLCQGSLNIFTLPELSPTWTSAAARLTSCTWIGGLDCDGTQADDGGEEDEVIMICQKTRLRLVRIGDRLSQIREIGFGGCQAVARRGDIACVADDEGYSLLDIVEQQRIPLHDISMSSEPQAREGPANGSSQRNADSSRSTSRTASVDGPTAAAENDRNAASDATPESNYHDSSRFEDQTEHDRESSGGIFPTRHSSLAHAAEAPRGQPETLQVESGNLERKPRSSSEQSSAPVKREPSVAKVPLSATILSPAPERFLLLLGTNWEETGVGMLLNSDGEPAAPPLEYGTFPLSMCSFEDKNRRHSSRSAPPSKTHLYAVLLKRTSSAYDLVLQNGEWDLDTNTLKAASNDLMLEHETDYRHGLLPPHVRPAGVCLSTDTMQSTIHDITHVLAACRMRLSLKDNESQHKISEKVRKREHSEQQMIARLSTFDSQVLVWAKSNVWSVTPRPTILQMDGCLTRAVNSHPGALTVERCVPESILEEYHDAAPNGELDFYTMRYLQQKSSLLLFADLVSQVSRNIMIYERDCRITSQALAVSELDPRIILALVPDLREEVIEGAGGIWAHRGLQDTLNMITDTMKLSKGLENYGACGYSTIQVLKGYLFAWRRKKGLASVTDEQEVFTSVDAALVWLLLTLDARSPRGPAQRGSVRAELNSVIDDGVECFSRVSELFENHKRLYLLSRLYQSRKMSRDVLATWRRIIEGEEDLGGELTNGQATVRNYLTKISDPKLVEEYGSWLARKDPSLGVQVFADRNSKVCFEAKQAVKILQANAPAAVKIFLEHLVFDKNLPDYANDLITYYLDSVLSELESNPKASSILLGSYHDYRARSMPKPTYSQFAEDLDIDADWWRNRLRLLQLLGGSHGAASNYDVSGMLERIRKHEDELVPEMIVLAGKQGQHNEAIRLLVQGLADYDTAVSYCVRGGSSTYSPLAGSLPDEAAPSREQQEKLFEHLLHEFLRLENEADRIERTSELLERFAGWFDPVDVLSMIPPGWSIEVMASFVETSLRHLITERNETAVVKALLSCDNLNTNYSLIEKMELVRPLVDRAPLDVA